jgi:hypothetical protein
MKSLKSGIESLESRLKGDFGPPRRAFVPVTAGIEKSGVWSRESGVKSKTRRLGDREKKT